MASRDNINARCRLIHYANTSGIYLLNCQHTNQTRGFRISPLCGESLPVIIVMMCRIDRISRTAGGWWWLWWFAAAAPIYELSLWRPVRRTPSTGFELNQSIYDLNMLQSSQAAMVQWFASSPGQSAREPSSVFTFGCCRKDQNVKIQDRSVVTGVILLLRKVNSTRMVLRV